MENHLNIRRVASSHPKSTRSNVTTNSGFMDANDTSIFNADLMLTWKRFINKVEFFSYFPNEAKKSEVSCIAIYSPSMDDVRTPPLLITACGDGIARAWNLLTGKLVREYVDNNYNTTTKSKTPIIPQSEISCLAVYSPSKGDIKRHSPLLVTGSSNDKDSPHSLLLVWNILTGKLVSSLFDTRGHKKGVLCVAIRQPLSDNSLVEDHIKDPILVSAGIDKTVVVWNLATFGYMSIMTGGIYKHSDLINSIFIHLQPIYDETPVHQSSTSSANETEMILDQIYNNNKSSIHIITEDLIKRDSQEHFDSHSLIVDKSQSESKENNASPRALKSNPMALTHQRSINLRTQSNTPGLQRRRSSVTTHNHHNRNTKNANENHNNKFNQTNENIPIKYQTIVFTASTDKTVIYWNLETNRSIKCLKGHTKLVTNVIAFSPKSGPNKSDVKKNMNNISPVVVTTSMDKLVIVWDLVSGNKIRKLEGHSEKVNSVSIVDTCDGCGPRVITCGDDKKSIIFDLLTGEIIRIMSFHKDKINSIAAYTHPTLTGMLIATSSKSKLENVVIWNFAKKERTRKIVLEHMVTCVAIFENRYNNFQSQVVIATVDGICSIFDLKTGSLRPTSYVDNITKVTKTCKNVLVGHTDRVNSVVVYEPNDVNETPLAITGGSDKIGIVWNMITGEMIHKLIGHAHIIFPLALYTPIYQKHQPWVVTGSIDATAKVWELDRTSASVPNFSLIIDLKGHAAFVRSIAIFPPANDTLLPIVVTGSADTSAIIWDCEKKQPKRKLIGQHNAIIYTIAIFEAKSKGEEGSYLLRVVTGGFDCKTVVWDFDTGNVLHVFYGHSDSVTALAVFNPPDRNSDPLLITGSIDKTMITWNLHTYEQIDKFIAHTDRLMSIVTYIPSNKNDPILISGSDDKSVLIWEDALYSFPFMPLSDTIKRSFQSDYDGSDDYWPIISELAIKYGVGLFIENSELFNYAVALKASKFLVQFKTMLTYVLRFIPKMNGNSLLFNAIKYRNLESIRVILDCWIENLNTDMHDYLTEILFHPSYFFNTTVDLVLLADTYPSDFMKFICSIKLIHMHANENKVSMYNIHDETRSLVTANNNPNSPFIWTNDDINAVIDSQAQPVTTLYLPLENCLSITMFEVYQAISTELEDTNLFNNDIGLYAYRYVWESHIKEVHLKAIIKYCLFLFILTFSSLTYGHGNALYVFPASVLMHVLTLLAIAIYISEEYTQMIQTSEEKQKLSLNNSEQSFVKNYVILHRLSLVSNHLSEVWNAVDFAVICTALIGIITRLSFGRDTPSSRCFLAIAVIVSWFKVLYFMKPFEASGPLVSMIIKIVFDIRYFMVVLLAVLFGFSVAFWLLTYPDPTITFPTALFNSFLFMLGQNLQFTFESSVAPSFTMFILVIFMSFMLILMLNALIAIMGESFSSVRAVGSAQWRLEQASIILDQQFLLPKEVTIPSYLYVLRYTSDMSSVDVDSSNWTKRLKIQKSLLEDIMNKNSKKYLTDDEWLSNLIETKIKDKTDLLDRKLQLLENLSYKTEKSSQDTHDPLTIKVQELEFKIDQLLNKKEITNEKIEEIEDSLNNMASLLQTFKSSMKKSIL
eukprot:gene4486-6341_t